VLTRAKKNQKRKEKEKLTRLGKSNPKEIARNELRDMHPVM
jgi:hypothetical protein